MQERKKLVGFQSLFRSYRKNIISSIISITRFFLSATVKNTNFELLFYGFFMANVRCFNAKHFGYKFSFEEEFLTHFGKLFRFFLFAAIKLPPNSLFNSPRPHHSPSLPPSSIILSPLSLRQVMLGAGEPVAAHFSVTLLPSRTTMSVLVG